MVSISVEKIRRRAGKTIGMMSQEYLMMGMEDEAGRELEVITQWQGTCILQFLNDNVFHSWNIRTLRSTEKRHASRNCSCIIKTEFQ
jgi:hypothetical protein